MGPALPTMECPVSAKSGVTNGRGEHELKKR